MRTTLECHHFRMSRYVCGMRSFPSAYPWHTNSRLLDEQTLVWDPSRSTAFRLIFLFAGVLLYSFPSDAREKLSFSWWWGDKLYHVLAGKSFCWNYCLTFHRLEPRVSTKHKSAARRDLQWLCCGLLNTWSSLVSIGCKHSNDVLCETVLTVERCSWTGAHWLQNQFLKRSTGMFFFL